ncbi:hypothetical protein ACLOJK_008853 [Asimina triloba]
MVGLNKIGSKYYCVFVVAAAAPATHTFALFLLLISTSSLLTAVAPFHLHSVFPIVNHTVLERLGEVDCIVYAMGSLFTSICPSLFEVLLLNGSYDRETSGLPASGFVTAITDALNRTYGDPQNSLKNIIAVDTIHDPNVGIIYDPKSLIQALADLINEFTNTHADADDRYRLE